MAHSEDSSVEEVTVLPPKSNSKSNSKSKSKSKSKSNITSKSNTSSKSKSKVDKPIEAKKDTEPETTGGAWIHSHTLYLIDEFKHQTEIGKGNDGGLKTDAWKQVTENFNKKFKLKDPLSRLKNHIQKLKKTYKAFDKIKDLSGAPGTDDVTGEVHADKDWWDHWINVAGNHDAKPIRNGGFPVYQAVATIMPEKHLRANGNEGFGTQSKKKKAASSSPVESDKDEDGNESNKEEDQSHVSNSQKDSDFEEIEVNRPASSQKKKPTSQNKRQNKYGLTQSELDLDSGSDETLESKFVRSKRSPIGASTSTAKRTRTTGPKLVAESISKAVDRVTSLEEKNDSDKVVIAKIKSEQHPMRQEAMAIFNKGCAKNLKPQHIIKVANELKKDDTASFFYHMDAAYRWDWLKNEAGVLEECQEVQKDDEHE